MSDPHTDVPLDGPLLLDTTEPPAPAQRPMDHRRQSKKKDRGPIPARQKNGFYADHETGDRLRSVTTILSGGVPKDALVHWAGNMCTDCAIENLPALVAASRFPEQLEELRKWIRKAHTRKKDERADVGSAAHKIFESLVLGTPMPEAILVGEGDDAEWVRLDSPDLAPFVENIQLFIDQWQPEFKASEMVVANPEHGYAGTLDFIISCPTIAAELRRQGFDVDDDADLMGDTKTGGTWEKEVVKDGRATVQSPALTWAGHVHGVYPEAGLQMSAYRNATVCWLPGGQRVPMPQTAEVGVVLHLRPEGYRLYPARCGDLQYAYFRHAQMVDEWSSRIASAKADQPIIGKPLALPKAAKAVA